METSRFKSNLRFALSKESYDARENTPLNQIEKIGNLLSWVAYELRAVLLQAFTDPRFITICFTAFAMILSALLFYPTDTWFLLFDTSLWVFEHINWRYVRFFLWILSEVTILGVGMRAFGRFSNQKLIDYYQVIRNAN